MSWITILAAISPIVVAILTLVTVWSGYRNAVLKRKYRRILNDCLSLYEIEQRLSTELEAHRSVTARSLRNYYRACLREEGIPPISDRCTPTEIRRELDKL